MKIDKMKAIRGVLGFALAGVIGGMCHEARADICPSAPQVGVKVEGFWHEQYKKLVCKWMPNCIRQMEAGGKGEELLNLVATGEVLAGKKPSVKFKGCPWSDAYPYNTMEAMCLALEIDPGRDAEFAKGQAFLRRKMEEWIPIILAAQEPCGYIHSFHDLRMQPHFKDASKHEFYVMGYFIEMGVAHYRMTKGKDRRLYDAAIRCADHLDSVFGPAPKRTWLNGHPGLEYALCRLADSVNASEGPGKGDKYARLARHFIRNQHAAAGNNEGWYAAYHQAERPAWEMKEATGHAVRATYFYTAMSALASRLGDGELGKAADRLFDNAINRKEYITGGVGASWKGEAFAGDYDLANNGYCESCASCGMSFWAKEQHRRNPGTLPVDVQERLIYNNLLGSISEDGETFYYQNPLDSNKVRYPWHGCPCCVGNIPRTLLALKDEAYTLGRDGKTLYADHFLSMEGCVGKLSGTSVAVRQETDYPWGGSVKFTLSPEKPAAFAFAFRIPNRTESRLYTAEPYLGGKFELSVNGGKVKAEVRNGYAVVERTWKAGDEVELVVPMDVQRIRCDSRVAANRGRVALQRGPIVYNFEQRDQEIPLDETGVPISAEYKPVRVDGLFGGYFALKGDDGLVAVPNYARLNRGACRSIVWMKEGYSNKENFLALERAAKTEAELDKRTVDYVVPGDEKSEKDHGLTGRNINTGGGMMGGYSQYRWRHAGDGGYFAYTLSVGDDPGPRALVVKYFTREVGRRIFDILVDGKFVYADSLGDSGKFGFAFREIPIPQEILKGKKSVEVRFAAKPGCSAGGIFGLRMVKCPAAAVPAAPAGAVGSSCVTNDLYMVIDISGGPKAKSYPVSYLSAVPNDGAWPNEYKTTKLVLRKISPGSFKMGGAGSVTITKPFYAGVFEVTQKQFQLVMGWNPSVYRGDMRPVEAVGYNTIRGGAAGSQWPKSGAVDNGSFVHAMRVRTGMASFDLPSEAQWEYACRAGTTSDFNNGGSGEVDLRTLGRFNGNMRDGRGGFLEHTTVGSYAPNAWGLYDMHGNVNEWCLDWYGETKSSGTDPKGAASGTYRVYRGGGWYFEPKCCTSSLRNHNPCFGENHNGFRLFCSANEVK